MQTETSTRSGEQRTLPDLFDREGYLIDPARWREDLACQLAADAGIGSLVEALWQVLHYLRDYFRHLGIMPPPRSVCRKPGMRNFEIKALFGGCLQVGRITALPNPGRRSRHRSTEMRH